MRGRAVARRPGTIRRPVVQERPRHRCEGARGSRLSAGVRVRDSKNSGRPALIFPPVDRGPFTAAPAAGAFDY
ncbi:DUF397 domain-containing protein [Nocardia sp. CT2-14]|uniref:DUF397 domain-containing protein n=1 Tax=Nocardia aurantiaca TaxID=2675850 RepID=A0A6I3KXD4_9NOCA|nr:DUF397 domain-containing protein [Nocardia aurantiaca]